MIKYLTLFLNYKHKLNVQLCVFISHDLFTISSLMGLFVKEVYILEIFCPYGTLQTIEQLNHETIEP